MKNLKRFVAMLMMATLFSTSFTSCVDSDVSPAVEAIYEAQADLIAAQIALKQAEADYWAAQAAAEEAQALLLIAQAEAAADVAEGELAIALAQAGLTDAQAALIMAEAASLADLTMAQVAVLMAEAGLTDAQAALLMGEAAIAMAEAGAIEALAEGELAVLLAQAGLTDAEAARVAALTAGELAEMMANAELTEAEAARVMALAYQIEMLTDGQLANLMAEANLTQAEADQIAALTPGQLAVLIANAAWTDAQTAQVMATVAGMMADQEWQAMKREQELRIIIAETDEAVAAAQNRLAEAQVQFEIDMADLMNDLAEKGAEIALEHAGNYAMQMMKIGALELEKLQKIDWVAEQELALERRALTQASMIADLEGQIMTKEADIAMYEADIAMYEALIADPNSAESITQALKDRYQELAEENAAIAVEIAEINNQIDLLYIEYNHRSIIENDYMNKLFFHDQLVAERDALVQENANHAIRIAEIEGYLTDYDGTTATKTQTRDDAQDALDILDGELTALRAARDAADQDVVDATADVAIAQGIVDDLEDEKDDLEADIANLDGPYRQAINQYRTAVENCESDTPPALQDLQDAQDALDLHLANELLLQGTYDLWKPVYEADPAGQTQFPGPDMILGDKSDAFSKTYVQITAIAVPGSTDAADYTFDVSSPVYANNQAGLRAALGEVSAPWVNFVVSGNDLSTATSAEWYNVEQDDFFTNNVKLFRDAEIALFASQGLTQGLIDTRDAAQLVVDNLCDDVPGAQENYEYWRDLFDEAEAVLAAKQLEIDTAIADELDPAEAAETAAIIAAAAAQDAVNAKRNERNDQIVVRDAAQTDLDDWLATTEQQWENRKANREESIATNDILIAELQIGIDKALEEVTELQAAYDAIMETPYAAELLVRIYEQYDMRDGLNHQIAVNNVEMEHNRLIAIAMWGSINDAVTVEDLEAMIVTAQNSIAACEDAIADLEEDIVRDDMSYDEMVAMTQRWIDLANETIAGIDAEIAALEMIAAEYKALLDAALAS